MLTPTPSLSIIIPAFNEADYLPLLLHDLAQQQRIYFDLTVVDGGSTDLTIQCCESIAALNNLALTVVSTAPGRARQMNLGAQHAASDDLLFLHADSRILDPHLLANAQQAINNARGQNPHSQIAGHFPLRFAGQNGPAKYYYFYESKSHLNRPDCINGDQGFWISKSFFDKLGRFDESLPYMEDAKIALKIFETGEWITLPGEIGTSARRFETEGFTRRQILNSFLCNFNAMGNSLGADQFFQSTLDVYKTQDQTSALQLRPFLTLAHRQMNADSFSSAITRWYKTGAYIASNAWQLAFAIDCRRNRKLGLNPGVQDPSVLKFYDRHLAQIAAWPIVKTLTALLTIIWFYSLFLMR